MFLKKYNKSNFIIFHPKKIFFNYLDPPIYEKDYFEQNESDRNNHEIF